jgi:hypothetical protein
MNNVTSKRRYAGCYDIEVFGIKLELEETNQSCCGRSEPPRWVLMYDSVFDLAEFESKRNAMDFLKHYTTEADIIQRIDGRSL